MNTATQQHIQFDSSLDREFAAEVRARVNDYFTSNRINRYADNRMWLKAVFMFLLLIVPYILLVALPFQFYQMILLSVISGVGMVGVGFNISHDACHNAFSANPKVNRFLGYSFNLVGISAYLWKIKHNLTHHNYTNIYYKDEDLLESEDVRLSPDAPLKPIHRFQHIYYFLLYPIYSFLWVFVYDIQILLRFNGNGSSDPNRKHPRTEVIIFIVSKILYIGYAVILPMFLMQGKWWQILTCFLTMHAVAGIIMSCVAKMGHIVDNVAHVRPDKNGLIATSWMVHELNTTSNFSINSRLTSWLTGGLNFQIEHHLFPGICSIHYQKISPIIREITRKHHLPYHYNKNIWTGLLSHYRTLKRLGSPDQALMAHS